MPDRQSLGGPAASEPPFVAELRRIGVEVAEETYVFGEQLSGTSFVQRVRRVLRAARELRRRLRAEDFDIVHLNSSFDARALLRDVATLGMIRSASDARIFIKFHGSNGELLTSRNPFWRLMVSSLLGWVNGIGVLSSEEKENFLKAGISEQQIFIVKNAIENPPGQPHERSSLRQRLNVSPDLPLLLFIGRFIPAKGLVDVIRACAMLRDRGRDFRLLCVGDGPARRVAEAEAVQLELGGRVQFFGYIPEAETQAFYRESTMLVFPTYHYEGFPMVIFKSLAAGLPIITTRIRAARDHLRDPDNCLWVEPCNPEMLAERMIFLLDRPQEREKMRENDRRLAGRFKPESVTSEYLEIYEQIIGHRRRS